ncbi:hypothetical protein L7P61_21595, partial [Aeromonas veronii bv. sobria]
YNPSSSSYLSVSSRACVTLPVGVGYAAQIYATADDGFKSQVTDKFNLGETKCIDVSEVSDGSLVTVHVAPILATAGKEVACDPAFAKAPGKQMSYQASGPLWAPWCSKI